MWDLPRSEIEDTSPVLAGAFFTSESPGKPLYGIPNLTLTIVLCSGATVINSVLRVRKLKVRAVKLFL